MSIFDANGNAYNNKGERVNKICKKCGSRVGIFIVGEPIFKCTNKDCNKEYGVVKFKSRKNGSKSKETKNSSDDIQTESGDVDKIDTIIFDLGSVLVHDTIKENVSKTKLPYSYIKELAYVYFSNIDDIAESLTMDQFCDYYRDKLRPQLKKYANEAVELFSSSTEPFDYTLDLLKSLKKKGYKLYYLSNWGKASFDLCKEKGVFDFLKLFDGGVVSYQIGIRKPNKEIYTYLLKKYKLTPENCLFYDDKKENVDEANKLKIHGNVFSYKDHTENMIFNLPEISPVINEN